MPITGSQDAALEAYIQVVVANYIHVSATALLVYDTMLTMGREVTHVWQGRHFWFGLLYCTNSCTVLTWLDVISLTITWLSISTFSALRVFALSGKRVWLLVVVLCFGLVLPAADLYQQATSSVFVSRAPAIGCKSSTAFSLSTYQLCE
ncbi:hypothetical protein BV20DRAFT_188104 [Pilatotrama ljubarskyi]|nr:hypothetical protein BV20DRAFT_188104 [Pilatotrama ljubarskyi]